MTIVHLEPCYFNRSEIISIILSDQYFSPKLDWNLSPSRKIAKLLLTQPPRLVNCKYYWTKIIFKIYLFSRFNSVIFSFKQCKQNLRNRKKHKQKQIMSEHCMNKSMYVCMYRCFLHVHSRKCDQ